MQATLRDDWTWTSSDERLRNYLNRWYAPGRLTGPVIPNPGAEAVVEAAENLGCEYTLPETEPVTEPRDGEPEPVY